MNVDGTILICSVLCVFITFIVAMVMYNNLNRKYLQALAQLKVKRDKIYDIENILTSMLIEYKVGPNGYHYASVMWKGKHIMQSTGKFKSLEDLRKHIEPYSRLRITTRVAGRVEKKS